MYGIIPTEILLAENPVIGTTAGDCAKRLADSGYPYAAVAAKGSLLGSAIEGGRMFPCTAMFVTPTSTPLGEVAVNATRIANIDATDPMVIGKATMGTN